MNTEIERKFLVKDNSWMDHVESKTAIAQAYLSKDPDRTVRVRIAGDEAFITIKGRPPADRPLDTPEFEYAIPVEDAEKLLKLCLPGTITKVRHLIPDGPHTWEVDVFHGENEGLIMAEIELASENEPFNKPAWLGEEVTYDFRYKNGKLAENPFTTWEKDMAEHSTVKSVSFKR